jgi:thiamine-monophosphate kinase
MSEAEIIALFTGRKNSNPMPLKQTSKTQYKVFFGPGDDVAVIGHSNKSKLLVSTDSLVEDVHFRLKTISPQQLGAKSLIVSLSDLASKGARPVGFVLSLSVPRTMKKSWLVAFAEGMIKEAKKNEIQIVGGDTTASPGPIFINVTVFGELQGEPGDLSLSQSFKARSSSKPGDLVCVTHCVGDSAMGLEFLEKKLNSNGVSLKDKQALVKAHQEPVARMREGRFLANSKEVHSMMDLSDSVFESVHHICKASKVSAKIDAKLLPISEHLARIGQKKDLNPIEYALLGAEDYGLLFTVPKKEVKELEQKYRKRFKRGFTVIGQLEKNAQLKFKVEIKNPPQKYRFKPFKHF